MQNPIDSAVTEILSFRHRHLSTEYILHVQIKNVLKIFEINLIGSNFVSNILMFCKLYQRFKKVMFCVAYLKILYQVFFCLEVFF